MLATSQFSSYPIPRKSLMTEKHDCILLNILSAERSHYALALHKVSSNSGCKLRDLGQVP